MQIEVLIDTADTIILFLARNVSYHHVDDYNIDINAVYIVVHDLELSLCSHCLDWYPDTSTPCTDTQ